MLVVRGAPPTWEQQLVVATLAGGERSLAVAESAARFHRLDGFEGTRIVHVSVPNGRRLVVPDAVVSQTSDTYPRSDIVVIDGVRCSGLARTVCDLAQLGPAVLERALDDFERRGASLGWLAQTARRLRTRGRPAIGSVEAEVHTRMSGGRVRGSWFEKLVEECLRSPLIPGLVRQLDIDDADGAFIGRVDLAVPGVRLAIECNSRRWHTGTRKEIIDQRRDNRLGEIGWDVSYLGWEDATRTPQQVCRFIERIVARRAADLGVDLASERERA